MNTGVARVKGSVNLDTNDLQNSAFDLSIYPADEQWRHALNPDGTLPADYVPDATDRTLLTFKSERILRTNGGKVKIIGELTLTRVERSVTADANEAYAEPVYGDLVIHAETHEVTFLFPNLGASLPSGPLTPVALQKTGDRDLSGSPHVGHEDFPDLSYAVQDTNWSAVVQDKQCQMPSTVGEDYHGPTCTGTLIAATTEDNCHMPTTVGGEDYSGPICAPPSGNQTTIVLDLKMLRPTSSPEAGMASGNAATR